MEQQFSTSKVAVEYFDPHDVFKLIAPGLIPRLPLHNLHWPSHSGPLRSIDTLHVELVRGGDDAASTPTRPNLSRAASSARDDGFQTQSLGGRADSTDTVDTGSGSLPAKTAGGQRRHQIPGLRRTPYLKVMLVRCDDNDSYKSTVRAEIRDWIKAQTPPATSSKKASKQEKHDAFEWLIVHVVIPNTVAATQPRSGTVNKNDTGTSEKGSSSRWRSGSTPLMEKLRSDFNASGRGAVDRVAQIRIGINDVPYDSLPRVVPAVPSGYSETDQDAETAWNDLITKFKSLILTSFEMRVTQYEEDIKERDGQRSLPGWNFCTFFILKEGLARGFENVGLVDDALVGYDELSVGLDAVIEEQAQTGSPERHGGSLRSYTEELRAVVERALVGADDDEEEAVDMQSKDTATDPVETISISSTKKAYRDMILENKVSIFDFRCYIFSRQIALLLRLGNASSTREELLAKLKEQQDSVLHGVAPLAPPPRKPDQDTENLDMLAEICRRTLQFIPAVSQVMREDMAAALKAGRTPGRAPDAPLSPAQMEIIDNITVSFAFSVAQQMLAQTSTKALPIPPSTLPGDGHEPKAFIPEPKTMMHPARSSSLRARPSSLPPLSPGIFPGPGRRASATEGDNAAAQFLKTGLEELAARRADLYLLSRSVLESLGKKRGWSNGWDEAPIIGSIADAEMVEISLDDDAPSQEATAGITESSIAGIDSFLLRTATDNVDDFYRLYEILTDKALRHYTVANYDHAVQASMADLAVLKVRLKEYRAANSYFNWTTPFFGGAGWSLLELSMLVMWSQCLMELQPVNKEDYVRVALTLLMKACAAEKDRLYQKYPTGLREEKESLSDLSPLKGVVAKLFELAPSLPTDARVPLSDLFTDIQIAGPPEYVDRKDSCSLTVSLWSLLPEEISLDGMVLKAIATDGGPCKELVFGHEGEVTLKPGRNRVKLGCNSVVPGTFEIESVELSRSKLILFFEKGDDNAEEFFKRPVITLYQRTGALDVQTRATKHITLDKNNSLDLELSTGWNSLKSCEIRVRPATGGLRLLTKDAKFVGPSMEFSKPPEAGVFNLGAVGEDAKVTLRFPYSVEQEVGDVAAKIEVKYVNESGESFFLAKSVTIPVSLALGVNVQDVFKHQALFSRFNVSTAVPSPLRLYKSELAESELFEPSFGVPPTNPVMIFPKQTASFLYKVHRKQGSKSDKAAARTMHLKLHYSLLRIDVEEVVTAEIMESLNGTPLHQYSRLVRACVLAEMKRGMQAHDLERAGLVGEVTTAFLAGVSWERYFEGLGTLPGSAENAGDALSAFLREWQKSHRRVAIPTSEVAEPASILIPVEVPSVTVVHTADIQIHPPSQSLVESNGSGHHPTVCVNQVLSATLHLKWTRIWDTGSARREDQEFSYEVTAPADTWLLGGRRRGHFVIPRATASGELSSAPDTQAEIPLVLIAQREGWLPYPAVDIRAVAASTAAGAVASPPAPAGEADVVGGSGMPPGCEVDWRNLGETVRAVTERRGVTVSLDASGAGGGPLVLGSEEWMSGGGRIVA